MKTLKYLVLMFCINATAQVGIRTTTPEASSMLDITSTTKGILTPRMTTIQRNAISSPGNWFVSF